ncbi:MAG: hypothetical protein KF778_07810 [Rhodocyclaceae bacterium]|nr:hypothetical protein [Rhodocyclaceae bacterium]MBX3668295.1 hypothetical protein [Rhodocyclaceae bacterium]
MSNDRNYMKPTISSTAKQRSKTISGGERPWIPPGPGPSHNIHARKPPELVKPPESASKDVAPPLELPKLPSKREQDAALKIQSAFRGYQGRKAADKLRVERQKEIQGLLTDDKNRSQGLFKITRTFKDNASDPDLANKTLFRRDNDATQKFTSYIQYDKYGGPIKRVDLTGATHGGVPTPHVLEFRRVDRGVHDKTQLHQYTAPEKNLVRPAYPWELPNDRESQKQSKLIADPKVEVRKRSNSATYGQNFGNTPKQVRAFWSGK